MNKYQAELINKSKKVSIDDNIPLLEHIYIIPTTKIHDSGFKIMYVIGANKDNYYLLDIMSDVVDFGEFMSIVKDLHIDIEHNGIIHLWSNRQLFKSTFRLSSCTFEMIDK